MKFYNSLDKKSKERKEIDEVLDRLKEDCSRGDKIPRDRWPKKYIREHQIQTLFRYRIRSGWRLIYAVYGTKEENVCTILEVFDHGEYEKRFGY